MGKIFWSVLVGSLLIPVSLSIDRYNIIPDPSQMEVIPNQQAFHLRSVCFMIGIRIGIVHISHLIYLDILMNEWKV